MILLTKDKAERYQSPEEIINSNRAGVKYEFNSLDFGTFLSLVRQNEMIMSDYNQLNLLGTVWMSENLEAVKFRNGDLLLDLTDYEDKSEFTNKPYYIRSKEGLYLYNWYAISDSRGLAPNGWHVPNKAEIDLLMRLHPTRILTDKRTQLWWSSTRYEDLQNKFEPLAYGLAFVLDYPNEGDLHHYVGKFSLDTYGAVRCIKDFAKMI